jgi:hypothetical protein
MCRFYCDVVVVEDVDMEGEKAQVHVVQEKEAGMCVCLQVEWRELAQLA